MTKEELAAIRAKVERYRAALEEISLGRGTFSTDPHKHCQNTVEDMKAVALSALHPEDDDAD